MKPDKTTHSRKELILILGMHRSGTSLITKAVQVLGASLGENLLPPGPDNPTGFWEDADVMQLNDELLDTLDLRWDIPSVLPLVDFSSEPLKPFRSRIRALLRAKMANSRLFAIKDPRFCLLLPIWLKVASDIKIKISFIVMARNPLDVAQSLQRRNNFAIHKSLIIWRNHNFLILKQLFNRRNRNLFIDYSTLLKKPNQELNRLAFFISRRTPSAKKINSMQWFIEEFLNPALCHSESSLQDICHESDNVQGLKELYQCLTQFSTTGWSREKTNDVLNRIESLALEAESYEFQRHLFKEELQTAIEEKIQVLQAEKISALEQLKLEKDRLFHDLETRKNKEIQEFALHITKEIKDIVERKESELKELHAKKELELKELRMQKESELKELRAQKELELKELRMQKESELKELHTQKELELKKLRTQKESELKELRLQKESELQELDQLRCRQYEELQNKNQKVEADNAAKEQEIKQLLATQNDIDRHFRGAMQTVNDIKNSFSYRLGMTLTWPARKTYDGIKSFSEHPGNLDLAAQMALSIARHPVKSSRLLNWERVRNAYITFFRNPENADHVVAYYDRLLNSGVSSFSRFPENSLSETYGQLGDYSHLHWEYENKVSLIIVNYNGRHHLAELLSSLYTQDYEDYEIIFLDNGSSDGSVEYVRANFPLIKLIALKDNIGFAEGNNIGMEAASGRYYCLLNNDTQVEPDWLSKLVKLIQSSSKIGAVGSKILFWKKFALIELKVSDERLKKSEVWLDIASLEKSALIYQKWFFVSGWSEEKIVDGIKIRRFSGTARLWFPICNGQTVVNLRLRPFANTRLSAELSSSAATSSVSKTLPAKEWTELSLEFSDLDHPALQYLINNAASQVNNQGEVSDRGFGLPDDGTFDQIETVSALCGCAMLIRAEALKQKPIFASHFFAYFEDTELSLRIREAGYDLLYCPESVIYHKHASTSTENSSFFRYYVNRNRLLFLALHYPEDLWRGQLKKTKLHLGHVQTYYENNKVSEEESRFAARIPELFNDLDRLIPLAEQHRFFERPKRFSRIAVYNNFWNTLGGGEHHACVIAQGLQKLGPVDLISENEFSIKALEKQFDIDLKFCRKRILSAATLHHDARTTQQYDIFVNSTYGSDLCCSSTFAYYIVSFPYRLDGRDKSVQSFIETYTGFLANSRFTAEWIKQWWGVDSSVLYPSVFVPNIDFKEITKEKKILHVGRFFREGHNKKQLELVRAFKALLDQGKVDREWQLTLVGQVHQEQKDYFDRVKDESYGYPIDIQIDLSLSELRKLYEKSAIYWHATGLNENLSKHPELYEHFGITTVEAMSYGCVPIVINAGGQPEIIDHGKNGFLFNDEDELLSYSCHCAALLNNRLSKYEELSQAAFRTAINFSREGMKKNLFKILQKDGIEIDRDYLLF